jgi:murein L,D-transpeptidase YafK
MICWRTTLRSSLLISLLVGSMLYTRFIATERPPAPLTQTIDRIVIEKAARRMTVYHEGTALRVFTVRLGFSPEGDKERQGDGRTPEGTFRIDRKNPASRFHLSLGLDYPQRDDLVRAAAGGYSPGGDIFIHGQPRGVYGRQRIDRDWTAGCIAVTNAVIEELWRVTEVGTVVEVRP